MNPHRIPTDHKAGDANVTRTTDGGGGGGGSTTDGISASHMKFLDEAAAEGKSGSIKRTTITTSEEYAPPTRDQPIHMPHPDPPTCRHAHPAHMMTWHGDDDVAWS